MSSVYRKRLQAIRERLRAEALDAMMIQSPINRRYMSGFTGSAGTLVISQHDAWLLVDFRYVEQAKAQVDGIRVERVDKPLEDLGRLLSDHQLSRVAFEAGHLTVHEHQRLTEMIDQVTWEPRVDWIETLRGVKDGEELAAIQKAVAVADAAFKHILDFLRPGVTEREIALELEFFMRRAGAESLAFPSIVASGPNGALPHAVPTDRRITNGDLVTLDFGCVVDGYCSDITRTVAIGEPDEKSRDLYQLVLQRPARGHRSDTTWRRSARGRSHCSGHHSGSRVRRIFRPRPRSRARHERARGISSPFTPWGSRIAAGHGLQRRAGNLYSGLGRHPHRGSRRRDGDGMPHTHRVFKSMDDARINGGLLDDLSERFSYRSHH